MLVPRPLRAWLPRRSYIFVALNDDAHVVVSDILNQFEVLPVGALLDDLRCSIGENDSPRLGSAKQHAPTERRSRLGGHRPESHLHANICSTLAASLTPLHVPCNPLLSAIP